MLARQLLYYLNSEAERPSELLQNIGWTLYNYIENLKSVVFPGRDVSLQGQHY